MSVLLSLLAATGAMQAPIYFPPPYSKVAVSCPADARADGGAVVSASRNEWYAKQLAAAEEPSLYAAPRDRRMRNGGALRFTWLRTFHPPVTIRIEGLGSAAPRLIAKQLSGAGGYDPGHIDKRVERALTRQEARDIAALSKPSTLFRSDKDCAFGMDGARWIFESLDAAGYHFVDKWAPEGGPVRKVGMAMLGLTGWSFKDVY